MRADRCLKQANSLPELGPEAADKTRESAAITIGKGCIS
jgi:hypothetical protein